MLDLICDKVWFINIFNILVSCHNLRYYYKKQTLLFPCFNIMLKHSAYDCF